MPAFDPRRYQADVLAPLLASGATPDPWMRFGLDPADPHDPAAIRVRIKEVRAYWNAQRNRSAKYGPLLKALSETRAAKQAERELLEPEFATLREERRLALLEARAAEERERLEQLRAAVRSLSGTPVPESRFERLRTAARAAGVREAEFAHETAQIEIVREQGAGPLHEVTREEIRTTLHAFAQSVRQEGLGLDLYTALNAAQADRDRPIAPTSSAAEIGAARRRFATAYQSTADLNRQTWAKTICAHVDRWLRTEDRHHYDRARVETAKDAVRAMVQYRAAVGDEMAPADVARFEVELKSLGLLDGEARTALIELARESGMAVRTSEAVVATLACAACGRADPVAAGRTRCSRCGEPLFRPCWSCGSREPASAAACGACGAAVAAAARAERLVREAELLVHARSPAAALDLARQARRLAPALAAARDVEERADRAVAAVRELWSRVDRALAHGRVHEAAALLADLRSRGEDVPNARDELPEHVSAVLGARLDAAARAAARARAIPEARPADREAALVEVLRLASDDREAARALAALPPEPVRDLRWGVTPRGVVLSWTPSRSPGDVRYRVLRGQGRTPSAVPGAAEVALVTGCTVEDRAVEAGVVVAYAVVTERAGARSQVAGTPPFLVAREVGEAAVDADDGRVSVCWTAPAGSGTVVVERRRVGDGAVTVYVPRDTALVDDDVENGVAYEYRIVVEYRDPGGRRVRTPGVALRAAPAPRPAPVEDMALRAGRGGIELSWTPPPHGTVAVHARTAAPHVGHGDELDEDARSALGRVLDGGAGWAADARPGPATWYVPVTSAGSFAVAGRPVRHVAVPSASGATLIPGGRRHRLMWVWPDAHAEALVAWRADRFPTGPDDRTARRQPITRGRYRAEGGVAIPAGERSVFVAVYTGTRIDGELVYGIGNEGSLASVVRRAGVEIRYDVRPSGGRHRELVLDGTGELPEVVFVVRRGGLPLRREDGDRDLVSLGGPDAPRSARVSVKGVARPAYIRGFLARAEDAAAFTLVDPPTSRLLLR